MLINSNELSKALDRVSALASLDKEAPGILFDITDEAIGIYYHSSQKAIRNIIHATIEDPSEVRKVVFEYKRLTDIISYCKSSGDIKVDDIKFEFKTNPNGSGTAVITADKKMVYADNPDEPEVVSVYKQELSWWDINNIDNRKKILARDCCPNMYDTNDATEWEVSELRRVFSEITAGDNKVVYMSPRYQGAFAVNTNSTILVKTSTEVQSVMHIPSASAKALITAFSGLPDDATLFSNIILDANDALQACIFFTANCEISVYFAAAARVKSHLTSMSRHAELKYATHQVTITTSVFKDALKAAVNLNSQPKGIIKFVEEDGLVSAILTASNSGSSVSNEYTVMCTQYRTSISEAEMEERDNLLAMSLDLKMFLDIINTCKAEFIGFDIDCSESGSFLRIGFIDSEKSRDATAIRKELIGIAPDESLSTSDVMAIRDQYIDTCYYIAVQTA